MRTWIAIIVVLAVGVLGFARPFGAAVATAPSPSALPYYDSRDFTPRWSEVSHQVAPFQLVDQENQPLTERDLEGRIHVASFLFVQCPNLCPTLVHRLKPVQEAIRDQTDVLMVSYSVTPLIDTPEALAEFGRARGIDPAHWRLATGELSEIRRVIGGSYFADDERPFDGVAQSRLLHTEKVLLVDRHRRLRGIYNGTNAFEMERLVEDIATLRAET